MNTNEDIENKIYFSKYKPEKKIGEGSFGKIYSTINIHTNEKFALKMESKDGGQNLLESEAYVLCYLKGPGIPAVKSYGFSGDFNILVMELLHKSLEDLFQECQCRFSLKTVCMIADQMLTRIEYVHNKHIIHRDIKPDNFVMGIHDNSHLVYLIDFGLAKKYRSSRTLQHIKFTNNKKLTGTARYASINALRGCEQSRRDDLEAIGYVLMYFLRGSLPWQGLKVDKREDRYKKIYEKKKSTTAEELCQGFPTEFVEYINYTRNLGFEQDPDYEYLRGLFKRVMEINSLQCDYQYDWVKLPTYLNSLSNLTSTINHPGNSILDNTNKLRDTKIEHNNLNGTNILQTTFHLETEDKGNKKQGNRHADNLINERLNTRAANYNSNVQLTENLKTKGNTGYNNNNDNNAIITQGKEHKQTEKLDENFETSKDSKKKKKKNVCFIL